MAAPQGQRATRPALKLIATLGLLGIAGGAALLVSLVLERRIEVGLPTPTGPFAVGRVLYDWVDDTTSDTLAPTPGSKRELLVWIWYPAVGQTAEVDDYLPALLRAALAATDPLIFKLVTRDPLKVHAHSLRAPEVSPREKSYPVVIFRAGASAEVARYSTLTEDLASHGYVVVGFDAPYRTRVVALPDGRVMRRLPKNNPELCLEVGGQERVQCVDRLLNAWISDTAFVLDRLETLNGSHTPGPFRGHLDMGRVGVFGHSFGGATALEFCREDPRCKAGIDVDGAPHGRVIEVGLDRPFMILLGDHKIESSAESRRVMTDIQAVYDRLPQDARLRVVIRGANHFLFSDDAALRSPILLRMMRSLGIVRIEGRRQLAATAYCVHVFFDAYLKGAGASPLRMSSPLYPEIQVLD